MNYLQALNYGSKLLKLKNIHTSNLDTELLLSKAVRLTREKILINLESEINKKQLNLFKKFVLRRKKK